MLHDGQVAKSSLQRHLPTWVLVAAASCLAAILALVFLDSKSFWLDEAESVMFADPSHGLRAVGLADGGNFALYYLLLHVWLRFGTGDAFIRLLSVIPAVACIPVMFALGRRLGGVRVGLIAAFGLALNPFFIAYAQEARGYSLLVFLSLVSTLFFVRCLKSPRLTLDAAIYVLASTLMVYTHLFGVLVVAAHLVVLPVLVRGRARWRRFAAAYGLMLILLLPLARFAHHRGVRTLSWIPPLSFGTFGAELGRLAGGTMLLVFFVLLIGGAIFGALRYRRRQALDVGMPIAVVGSWLIIPIVLTAALSTLVLPLFVARYLIISLPPVVLAGSFALGRMRPPAAAAVGTLYVVLSAQGLWHYYFQTPKQDWRDAAALIVAQSQPGDAVVTSPSWLIVPLQHAIDRLPPHAYSPTVLDSHVLDVYPASQQADLVGLFATTFRRYARVWVVEGVHEQYAPAFNDRLSAQRSILAAALARDTRLAAHREFFAIDVRLYSREREGDQRHAMPR